MSAPEAPPRLVEVARLRDALAAATESVPILVLRLPALERIAWRRGLPAARRVERRASAAFAEAAARVLRADDIVAHDAGSDIYLAALAAPNRTGSAGATSVDARSALARIAASVEAITGLDAITGWTTIDATGEASFEPVIERALQRGEQERERFAFFSAIGHELRTPLSSIRGYLETLLADDVDASTRRRFTTIAYQETLRLSRLIDGMFEISLLDLHATFPTRATGSLDLALEAAGDACIAAADERRIRLVMPAVEATTVAVDGDRLCLIFINLLDNAIKHGRAGGTICLNIDVSQATWARIDIDDDGPGVPVAEREYIFRFGARGTTRATGSGIGLALARLMLERAGGRVEVTDAPAGGARFTVLLPRRSAGADNALREKRRALNYGTDLPHGANVAASDK